MTKNKALLLDIVREAPQHMTAEQLYLLAKARAPGIAMATVYNNLGALAEEGLIRRLHIDGLADRYDRNTDPHEHFICKECGEITDILFPDFTAELEKRLGQAIASYELNIRGTCPSCKKQNLQI
ncbi:MAG: transcriptional repressor [Clostridia bacterium]|nr:transcriptional repressor [Clostridia bacterium]